MSMEMIVRHSFEPSPMFCPTNPLGLREELERLFGTIVLLDAKLDARLETGQLSERDKRALDSAEAIGGMLRPKLEQLGIADSEGSALDQVGQFVATFDRLDELANGYLAEIREARAAAVEAGLDGAKPTPDVIRDLSAAMRSFSARSVALEAAIADEATTHVSTKAAKSTVELRLLEAEQAIEDRDSLIGRQNLELEERRQDLFAAQQALVVERGAKHAEEATTFDWGALAKLRQGIVEVEPVEAKPPPVWTPERKALAFDLYVSVEPYYAIDDIHRRLCDLVGPAPAKASIAVVVGNMGGKRALRHAA